MNNKNQKSVKILEMIINFNNLKLTCSQFAVLMRISFWENFSFLATAVQPVFNPFSQFVPQLELYSQLPLSLWSDPIALIVPKSTYSVLGKIQGDENLTKTQVKKWWKFEYFLTSRTKWKVTLTTLAGYFR